MQPPTWQEYSLSCLKTHPPTLCGFSLSVTREWMFQQTERFINSLWALGRLTTIQRDNFIARIRQ